MKAQKILNILLMVLIILLISIISFAGIYVQKQASMKNAIPDYKLGINLKGYRAISLDIKEEVDLNENKDDEEASSNEIPCLFKFNIALLMSHSKPIRFILIL